MRGAPSDSKMGRKSIRIIPADAGSTNETGEVSEGVRDHPRGCGEHWRRSSMRCPGYGSSPRMRGAPTRTSPSNRRNWDHPRGCGEHFGHGSRERHHRGSSPRMRGAPMDGDGTKVQLRIIPADAGSTMSRTSRCRQGQDHPRGCGEHSRTQPPDCASMGSSPRMRGAPVFTNIEFFRTGIIPADAGSTVGPLAHYSINADHPRGCGEHEGLIYGACPEDGSSPRMRGARVHTGDSPLDLRIIPADAGSTACRLI